jgi:hypothetical protein
MNVFNRLMVIIGLLLLLVGSGSLLMITMGGLDPEQWMSSPWHQVFSPFTQLEAPTWWNVVGLCLGVFLLSLLLLVRELTPDSNKSNVLTVNKNELGRITASITSLQDLVNHEAGNIEGVRESVTRIQDSSRGIHLHCRLSVDPNANTAQLGQQVQERVKASVEHYIGKPVAEVHLQTQIAPLTQGNKKVCPRVR